MNNNDIEYIKKVNDFKRTVIGDIVNELNKIMGFNSGNDVFAKGENPNGPTLVLRMPMPVAKLQKLSTLPNAQPWRYGTYLFDSYPKTGLWTMIYQNGKLVPFLIETENQLDLSKVNTARTPQEFSSLLLAKNPHLGQNIKVLPSGEIEIIGQTHGIDLPSTDWSYDAETGLIQSSLLPDYKFRVTFVNAHEASTSGESIGEADKEFGEFQKRSPIHTDNEMDDSKTVNGEKINSSLISEIIESVTYEEMVFLDKTENLSKDGSGTVGKSDDNTYTQVYTDKENNSRDVSVLSVNALLKKAYVKENPGVDPIALTLDDSVMTSDQFNIMMAIAKNCKGKSIKEVVGNLYNAGLKDSVGRIAIYFLTSEELRDVFNFDMSEMSVDMAVQEMANLATKQFAQEFVKTVSELNLAMYQNYSASMTRDYGIENAVMEKKHYPN